MNENNTDELKKKKRNIFEKKSQKQRRGKCIISFTFSYQFNCDAEMIFMSELRRDIKNSISVDYI